jgi:5'-methylthioadenosine phosphorylase
LTHFRISISRHADITGRVSSQLPLEPSIGVIGGSGLYDMEGFDELSEIAVTTPFGDPSDKIVGGRVEGRKVFFLPRHGVGRMKSTTAPTSGRFVRSACDGSFP